MKKVGATERFWLRCTPEEHKVLKEDAEAQKLTMGQVLLKNYFGYAVEEPAEAEYDNVIKYKDKTYVYKQKNKCTMASLKRD